MPTRIIPIPSGTSPEQQLSIVNKNFQELDNGLRTGLFYDSAGIPSISIGVQQDKTSRIRISKPGFDVTTATDDQLSFNSAQNVFKVTDIGVTTITVPANTTQTVSIAHGKSYIPIVQGYLKGTTDYVPLPTFTTLNRNDTTSVIEMRSWVEIYTDATNINVRTFNAQGSAIGPYTIRYYLLQETAS